MAANGAVTATSSNNQQHHSHHLHLGHSHKATGYAFSLNLCRSLGLWASNAPFPSNIQKPQYLPLNAQNQSVDWDELLRKFTKHNSSQAAHVVAASTRLELVIWRALQSQSSSATHDAQPRSRKTSITQSSSLENVRTPATPLPRDLAIDSATQRKNVELRLQELQKAVTLAGTSASESASHRVTLSLAYLSIGSTSESAQVLGIQQGAAPFIAAPDAPTHELDLQILGLVLKGLLQEHAGQTEDAITTYRSLPCSPPPPVPEAQRYIEVGLSRLAELQRDSSSLEAHRNYLALTSSFANVSPHKRLNIYTTYLSTLLARIAEYYNAEHSHHENQASTSPPDTSDLFTTFKSYESLLQTSPSLASFPRAGEPTLNMIQYLDLLYGFWRYSLLPSEWVVESLNRCFTVTYANQKLLRCLVFVLATMSFSSSDRPKARKWAIDALKNMRLYIGLFEKTRETDQAAIKREINAFRNRTQGKEKSAEASTQHQAASEEDNAEIEIETDENFCYVCCIGTRLLLWESVQDNLQEQEDARLDLISEAMEVISKAKNYMEKQAGRAIDDPKDKSSDATSQAEQPVNSDPPRLGPHGRLKSEVARQRFEVEAEVLLWLGVAKVESALAEADLEQGKTRAKEALQCLSSAARCVPAVNPRDQDAENSHRASLRTRSLYSLAYSHLELRDVASALPIAKKAVESLQQQEPGVQLEASDVQVWHLFVLILTAMKDWKRAKEVVELALHGWSDFGAEGSASASPEPLSSLPTFVRQKSGAVTRGDAPYDPSAIGGTQPFTQTTRQGQSSASETPAQVIQANGESESSTPSFVTPQDASEQSSQRARSSPFRKHGVGRFVTQKLTSDWDDLEAEIELLITRNRCIEAIEGPEYALQDLQKTVFTRFSKRREELEAGSSALQAIVALSPEPTSPQAGPSTKTSTYPYASKEMRNKVPNVQFQQDGGASGSNTPSRARSIIGSISLRHRSHSIKKTNTTQSQASGRLAVPSENGRPASITSTLSGNPSYEDVNAQTSPRAPSIVTNIEGSGSDTPSSGPQARVQKHHPRAARLLSKLWLTSAASFRRWGKYSECLGAINEAEDVAGNVDPDVWVQYAQYLTTSTGSLQNERAQLALQKAFAISTDHIPSVLALSTIRIDAGDMAIAEGFLDVATQTNAWDSPEAWYLLAKVYEKTKRQKRARECLLYALDLEETRPIRELRHTLERYL